MITEKKVLREVEKYRSVERVLSMKSRQEDYKSLVNKFGVQLVSVASGLNRTTLQQYLRTSSPNIGYEPLAQAKAVLGKFNDSE